MLTGLQVKNLWVKLNGFQTVGINAKHMCETLKAPVYLAVSRTSCCTMVGSPPDLEITQQDVNFNCKDGLGRKICSFGTNPISIPYIENGNLIINGSIPSFGLMTKFCWFLGVVSKWEWSLTSIGVAIIKISLIFKIRTPIPGKRVFILKQGPESLAFTMLCPAGRCPAGGRGATGYPGAAGSCRGCPRGWGHSLCWCYRSRACRHSWALD